MTTLKLEKNKCKHSGEQVIFIGQDGKPYGKCGDCNATFCLTVNYDTNNFRTTVKPTNSDKKKFIIFEYNDGTYIYIRKPSISEGD